MEKILLAFSFMADIEITAMGDKKALELFSSLLDRQDIFILNKKDGPMFYALARRFGLTPPFKNHKRLDFLDPEKVCRLLIQWRLLQIKLQEYEQKYPFKKLPAGSEMRPTTHHKPIQIKNKE